MFCREQQEHNKGVILYIYDNGKFEKAETLSVKEMKT